MFEDPARPPKCATIFGVKMPKKNLAKSSDLAICIPLFKYDKSIDSIGFALNIVESAKNDI